MLKSTDQMQRNTTYILWTGAGFGRRFVGRNHLWDVFTRLLLHQFFRCLLDEFVLPLREQLSITTSDLSSASANNDRIIQSHTKV